MEIKDINIKLPKNAESLEKFYQNCEIRKKFISGNKQFSEKHLKKAKHDLYRTIREFEDKCWDWTVIKAYYAIHHSGNAFQLRKLGQYDVDEWENIKESDASIVISIAKKFVSFVENA